MPRLCFRSPMMAYPGNANARTFAIISALVLLATAAVSMVGAATTSITFTPIVATSKAQVVAAAAKDPHANLFSGRMQSTPVSNLQSIPVHRISLVM